jgi:hypothetical protein
MRVLLDTHALLWWLAGDERLLERLGIADRPAATVIDDDDLLLDAGLRQGTFQRISQSGRGVAARNQD